MKQVNIDKLFSVEEYIQYEWTSQERHEFINGNLFKMPGEKDINNEMAGLFYLLLMTVLKAKGYQVYNHDVKVGIPSSNKYYYPDVFVTKELKTAENSYIKYEPELIVEVVSESTQINDYVDKFIHYTQIASLQYYIIVEPETTLISLYARENNEWVAHKYTNKEDMVVLPYFDIHFLLKEVYPI